MPLYFKRFLIVCVAVLAGVYHNAQAQTGSYRLQLKAAATQPTIKVGWTNDIGDATLPVQVVLRFNALPGTEERAALAKEGITLLDYVPDNSFTAIITRKPDPNTAARLPAAGYMTVAPEWKADNYLWRRASRSDGTIKVLVSLYGVADVQQFAALMQAYNGTIATTNGWAGSCYEVSLPAHYLRKLAGWYGVRYITPLVTPTTTDVQSIPAVNGTNVIAPLPAGYGLNGDSVTIGIGDNTSGIFHIDNVDRITNYNPAQVTNHGVHITGIVGGAAILDPMAQSMAPRAKMLNFFFSNVLSQTGTMYQQHNMTITNNSYTVIAGDCDYFGTYDLYSYYLDSLALRFPYVQHVFAAGNDGGMTCTPYPQGFGTMGGGYQPSKNTLVVGSTTHNLIQAADQSRGPVRDGRTRPDVVAVGANVYSTIRNNTYLWAGGTSMASPQVASGLGVLTQHYKRKNNTQPHGDLLKALVMGTATDMGPAGPDHSYGFGMLNMAGALKAIEENRFVTGTVTSGDSQAITITIPANTKTAKVLLYWHDVPPSPSAAKQLVNDLDIRVKTPDGTVYLPLVPDGSPMGVVAPASAKEDHLNNAEQVVIQNPEAGTYTIVIKGYSVPFGPQRFVVVYETTPNTLLLKHPTGGGQYANTDSLRVFWDCPDNGQKVKVELTTDGTNWVTLTDTTPAWRKHFAFIPRGINSGRCKIKISQAGTADVVSEAFCISDTPHVFADSRQCPGYVNVLWNQIPNATAYEVLKKVGSQMVVADTVSDTAYAFAGMSTTEMSYVALRPLLHGLRGYRSIALQRLANDGNCLHPASAGDLAITTVISPQSGRLLTASAPGSTSNLIFTIRNLYKVPCGSYTCAWRVNGGTWQQLSNPAGILAAGSAAEVNIPGLVMNTAGTYTITVAVHNTAVNDPVTTNDTLYHIVKVLHNNPISLATPYTDGFEMAEATEIRGSALGITPDGHWDFSSADDSGRIRTLVTDNITITGTRAMSLDQFMPMRSGSSNNLIGTFNLQGYDTGAHEVRIDFDYVLHGIPNRKEGNILRARGTDAKPWRNLFPYNFNGYPGAVQAVRSLSLTDMARQSGTNFGTSVQVAFGQNDTTLIAANNYGAGITIDNIRMYLVDNDAMLSEIVSPVASSCGLPGSVPLTVKVKNGVNYTLRNIELAYSLNGGAVHTQMVDSIKAKDSALVSFDDLLNIAGKENHSLNVWLKASGDSYPYNDSILNYEFRNSRIITTYPYLENFEQDNGGYYASGYKNSWEYGQPAAPVIATAASGTHAWKSKLDGRYNDLELSYLYTPCFDIAGLQRPMLSFSLCEDIENCGGIFCDGAWMEYSFDGSNWQKLGASGEGVNWYNEPLNMWNRAGFTRWHVATIPLPIPPAGKVLRLRFVLSADPAVTFEGLAIDDIHIYDRNKPILPATGEAMVRITPVVGQMNEVAVPDGIIASVQPMGNAGASSMYLYHQDTITNVGATQYILPRNYRLMNEPENGDSTRLQLYVTDEEVEKVAADVTCPSCTPVTDVYRMGITQYYNERNRNTENRWMMDDTGGQYNYVAASHVQWVPYENGYRATVTVKDGGELWFNNGGPTGTFGMGIEYLSFAAYRQENNVPLVFWKTLIDTACQEYVLQSSADGVAFSDMWAVLAQGQDVTYFRYADTTATARGLVHYRLKYILKTNGAVGYSPIRTLDGDKAGYIGNLTARMAGSRRALATWHTQLDAAMVARYELERSVSGGSYQLIANRPAEKRYEQVYTYADNMTGVATGTMVQYKVTTVLVDGTKIVLPERSLYWVDDAAVYAIYPNPVTDGTINLKWNAEPGTTMDAQITDMTGRVVETFTLAATNWDNAATVQTTIQKAGVYLCRFRYGGYQKVVKLVFQ
jgi:hypothetical protein